jgi:outer membrane protein assembly factor BamB
MYLMDINTGNLLARQPVQLVVTTPPVIDGGYAVFGTPIGQVLCHRFGDAKGNPLPPPLEEGLDIWGYSLDGAITAAPVRMGHTAGFVTEQGQVFFVDILSGSSRGTARISGGMDTNPVTDGRFMYVGSRDQSIYAFAPERSTYTWRERTAEPITVQPTYHDGTLYCTLNAEGLVAFDVSQDALDMGEFGRRRWVSPEGKGEVIAVQKGDLIVWNAPTLSRVDAKTGDIITSLQLKGVDRVITGNQLVDSDLLAIGTKGQLIRFSAR